MTKGRKPEIQNHMTLYQLPSLTPQVELSQCKIPDKKLKLLFYLLFVWV